MRKSAIIKASVRRFANTVIGRQSAGAIVALGPLVWNINPGHDQRYWYCCAASAKPDGSFHLLQLKVDFNDRKLADDMRNALVGEFIQRRPPVVLNLFDDELQFAGFCAAVWPSDRTTKLLTEVEREQAA
ncbi:MAG TPA: hypothetical protein VGI78_02215 [Acetobacteraceae bacterium]|jgi:hypothetical protein